MTGEEFARAHVNWRVKDPRLGVTGRIVGYCKGWNSIIIEPDPQQMSWPIENRGTDGILLCDDAERGYWLTMERCNLLELPKISPLPLPG